MAAKTLFTVDDFERIAELRADTARVELDEGEVIEMAPASEDHGNVGGEVLGILRNFIRANDLGRIYMADTGFRLSHDTVRAPDIAFVRKDRIAMVRSKAFAKGSPDLTVEVFSPSDSVAQLMRKVKQYFAAGTHTVWVVYPERKEVHVLEANGVDSILSGDDAIAAPELLPGFSTPISAFFRD